MAQIVLPYNWKPRPYQKEAMAYLDAQPSGRAVCVWHRRAGKDTVAGHQLCKAAHRRIGSYWHMLPTQRQGRKVVFDAYTKGGVKFLDAVFPKEILAKEPNVTEMKLSLKCGSTYQVVGSDQYNSLVGANPIGVVFSEWSLTDPRAWEFLRPILRENGGFAMFIYTPRGYNHGWDIKEIAQANSSWFYSTKTIDDTGVLSQEDIDEERNSGMPEEMIRQEYYCDFSAANVGSVLGRLIEAAEKSGRVVDLELYEPSCGDVIVSSDIGFRDAAAWWFWQKRPDGFALIDYMEESGMDADDWIDRLHKAPNPPDVVYLPFDAKAKTFVTKHTTLEQFLKGGFKQVRVVPQVRIADRINAARTILPMCHFNRLKCHDGLDSLRSWQYEWDEERKVFSKEPLHDWASHGSDAFTYGATVLSMHALPVRAKEKKMSKEETEARGLHYAFSLDGLFDDKEQGRGRAFHG